MGLLSPALSSRGLSIAHKCTAPFRPIPKGLCHKAQGCEPRATLGRPRKMDLYPNGVASAGSTR